MVQSKYAIGSEIEIVTASQTASQSVRQTHRQGKTDRQTQTCTLVRTCCASAAAASAVSAVGFSNMRCTVKSSWSRDSEYSGLMSTSCLFNSTTLHGRKAAEKGGEEGGSL